MDTEDNSDLWEQFAGPSKSKKKSSATDGSEWTGNFDRRKQPRDECGDQKNDEAGD